MSQQGSEKNQNGTLTNLNDRNTAKQNQQSQPVVVVNNNSGKDNKFDKEKFENRNTQVFDNIANHLFRGLNQPLDQDIEIKKLVSQLQEINTTFETLYTKRDTNLKKELDKIDKEYDETKEKYRKKLKEIKPMDIEVKSRHGDWEEMMAKIINRMSFSSDGKAETDLGDFLANIKDIQEYSDKVTKVYKKDGTSVEIKNELTSLANSLSQVANNNGSIDGVTDTKQAIREMFNGYISYYNTRSFFRICWDYIKNFFGSIFAMYTVEHSYERYNELSEKINDALGNLNSSNPDVAQQARKDLLNAYNDLENEMYYSVGKDLDKKSLEKLKKVVNCVMKESGNIDNTEMLQALFHIGGKFNLKRVMQSPSKEKRQKLQENLEKFIENHVLPDDLQDKEKYAKYFLQGGNLDKIKDKDENENKKVEKIWEGLIGDNQSIFSKKKFANDAHMFDMHRLGYENRYVQDKIDAITTADKKLYNDYLDEINKQVKKYNSIIATLNHIQNMYGVDCYSAFGGIAEKIKDNFNIRKFKEKLKKSHEGDVDIGNDIDTDEKEEEYKKLANQIKEDLENTNKDDNLLKQPKDGKWEDYKEICDQIAKVRNIKKVQEDSNKAINDLDAPDINNNFATLNQFNASQDGKMNDLLKKLRNNQTDADLMKELLTALGKQGSNRNMGGGFGLGRDHSYF